MAAFGQLKLTDLGIMAQLNAQDGKPLKFTKIGVGSGVYNGDVSQITKLVKEEVLVGIDNAYMEDNVYTVSGSFSNENLETSFVWREIGLYFEDEEGNNVLYSYANAGERYDYIPATTDARYTKTVRVATAISNAENVSIESSSGTIYVEVAPYEAFKKKVEDHMDAVPSSVVNRWIEHGGDSIVTKSLIETITDKINNDGILSGEFTFFNILYSDGCPDCTAYGLIKYTKHLDSYVTVHMLSENQGVDWQYARFVLGETAWDKDWVGYAPSGYGLGEQLGIIQAASASETHATYCGKIDAILSEMGDYEIKFVRAVPPELHGKGVYACVLYKYDDSFAELRVISSYSITRFVWRILKTNGGWNPLEWENPPMELGVEYRTTERWNGYVVYAKAINCGVLSTTTTETQNIAHGIDGITQPIRAYGQMDGDMIPYYSSYYGKIYCDATKVNIRITADVTSSFPSGKKVVVILWYAK